MSRGSLAKVCIWRDPSGGNWRRRSRWRSQSSRQWRRNKTARQHVLTWFIFARVRCHFYPPQSTSVWKFEPGRVRCSWHELSFLVCEPTHNWCNVWCIRILIGMADIYTHEMYFPALKRCRRSRWISKSPILKLAQLQCTARERLTLQKELDAT